MCVADGRDARGFIWTVCVRAQDDKWVTCDARWSLDPFGRKLLNTHTRTHAVWRIVRKMVIIAGVVFWPGGGWHEGVMFDNSGNK